MAGWDHPDELAELAEASVHGREHRDLLVGAELSVMDERRIDGFC
jgi:hypothetical protein